MKKVAMSCTLAFLAGSAFGAPSKEEVKRLSEAGTILTELRQVPDQGIPEDLWNKAKCVLVIPSMKKAAFVVGGEYGSGVMSCRTRGDWSAPIFMQLAKGSWGLQVGAQLTDVVLLVMNERGVEKLLEDKVSLGADATVAAGPVGRTAAAATDAQMNAQMLSWSRSQGLFAGIDLSGGVLRPDKEALARSYKPDVTASAIALGPERVAPPAAAEPFLRALRHDVRATSGRKP